MPGPLILHGRRRPLPSAFAALLGGASLLGVAGGASGQVVQLPEYHVVGLGTTVSVPDGGSAYLGGIGSVREGSTARGLPFGSKIPGLGPLTGSRGLGREVGGSSISVSAHIHDFEAMEAELAAESDRRAWRRDPVAGSGVYARSVAALPTPEQAATARQAAFLTRHAGVAGPAPVGAVEPTPTVTARPASGPEGGQGSTAASALGRFDAALKGRPAAGSDAARP